MKSIEEVRDYLLENRVNKSGNLDLSGLDFSDFDCSVFIDGMKVKHSLFQNRQQVGKTLYQDSQTVERSLYQNWQQVGRNLYQDRQTVGESLFQNWQQVEKNLFQNNQEVGKDLFSHKLEDNEKWEDHKTYVKRIKKLKPITKKELEEMGYELI